MAIQDDQFVPVTGGVPLRADRVRADTDSLNKLKASSDLDLHILRLLTLHPQLADQFGKPDLTQLTDDDKKSLLQDLNDSLGIKSPTAHKQ